MLKWTERRNAEGKVVGYDANGTDRLSTPYRIDRQPSSKFQLYVKHQKHGTQTTLGKAQATANKLNGTPFVHVPATIVTTVNEDASRATAAAMVERIEEIEGKYSTEEGATEQERQEAQDLLETIYGKEQTSGGEQSPDPTSTSEANAERVRQYQRHPVMDSLDGTNEVVETVTRLFTIKSQLDESRPIRRYGFGFPRLGRYRMVGGRAVAAR